MPNQLGIGNLTGISTQDLNAFQQAFQQVHQVSLQQQLQSYMELMHGSGNLNQSKSGNSANAQAQAAAQFFQVNPHSKKNNSIKICSLQFLKLYFTGCPSRSTIASPTKTTTN